jgi:DNA-binding NarL/FixJ family response regulator
MTSKGATIRCLIADDQAMVREGFAAMLAAEPGIMVAGRQSTARTRCARRAGWTPTWC